MISFEQSFDARHTPENIAYAKQSDAVCEHKLRLRNCFQKCFRNSLHESLTHGIDQEYHDWHVLQDMKQMKKNVPER